MSNWNAIRDVVNGQLGNVNFGSSDPLDITKVTPYTAWTDWTPTWTGASTNPAIGSGTLSGRYTRIGKLVSMTIVIAAAANTTFGTGAWIFSLPVTSTATAANGGTALALDSSTGNYAVGIATFNSSTTIQVYGTTSTAAWQSSVPWTWGTNDTLKISLTYEAA
jgi:hypothetical protein